MLNFSMVSYTLTPDEAKRGYILSGVPKEKKQKCKITTLAFSAVTLVALYNIIRLFINGGKQSNMLLYLYFAIIFVCGIIIYGTWKSYFYGFEKAAEDIANGTPYNVYINENGISVEIGADDEVDFPRTEFKVAEDEEIFLISTKNGKLVMPKRVIPEGDVEFVAGLIKGEISFSGEIDKSNSRFEVDEFSQNSEVINEEVNE